MAKDSKLVYGASGKTNVLTFEPENLHLVTDKTHPLYDERIHLPISEAMVLNIMDQGVLEPIIVWKDPETGLSCVVDGRSVCAYTGSQQATVERGQRTVTGSGSRLTWLTVRMAQAMVSANEIRQADTPLGRAKMADALERGHDEDDLALMFGVVSRPFAQRCPAGCHPGCSRCSGVRNVTVTQARQLASLKPEEQRERSLKSKRQLLAQPAMKKPGVSVRSSVMQSRA
jgi:ParB family chromosome partitioning protein